MLLGHRIEILHYLAGKGHYIDTLHLHLHFFVLNLTEVEYLIDETQHTICVALHNL